MDLLIKAIEQALDIISELSTEYKGMSKAEKPHSWTGGYYQGVSDGYLCAILEVRASLAAAKRFAKEE